MDELNLTGLGCWTGGGKKKKKKKRSRARSRSRSSSPSGAPSKKPASKKKKQRATAPSRAQIKRQMSRVPELIFAMEEMGVQVMKLVNCARDDHTKRMLERRWAHRSDKTRSFSLKATAVQEAQNQAEEANRERGYN